jgi:hypothetical protein
VKFRVHVPRVPGLRRRGAVSAAQAAALAAGALFREGPVAHRVVVDPALVRLVECPAAPGAPRFLVGATPPYEWSTVRVQRTSPERSYVWSPQNWTLIVCVPLPAVVAHENDAA